jgi:hypothetical protein
MSQNPRNLTHWYVISALSVCLLARPGLAEHNACETECAAAFSKETQACLSRCPKQGDSTAERVEFQTCVEGCSGKFDRNYKKCAKGCGGEEDAKEAARKKQEKKQKEEEKKNPAKVHGSQGLRR